LEEMDNDMRDILEQLKDLHDGTEVFLGVGDEAEIQFNTEKQGRAYIIHPKFVDNVFNL